MESFDPKVVAILTSIDASMQKISNSLSVLEQTASMRLRVEELAARAGASTAAVMKAAFELRGQNLILQRSSKPRYLRSASN
jgi:transcriptional regulator GlxA family with amidase domain